MDINVQESYVDTALLSSPETGPNKQRVCDLLGACDFEVHFRVLREINLRHLARNAYNVYYKIGNGQATIKLRSPMSYCHVWRTGQMMCRGAPTEKLAKVAARRYSRIVQKYGRVKRPDKMRFREFRVHMVRGNISLPYWVNIARFSADNRPIVYYEPELDYGVSTVSMKDIRTTIRVYATGRLVLMSNNMDNLCRSTCQIIPMIKDYCTNKVKRT